ncbi:MAG: O-antigen ligase family protein [Burkholderiales bacterium]|nr:O-antigen ligase family protein [Burkholderiales bacterium]
MPEHLKALIVILALAGATFAFAKAPACASGTAPADFSRRRNLWLGITAVSFLAHDFWIYIVVSAVMLALAVQREPDKLTMYFFLLFAVPAIPAQITGLGVIQHFFTIDYLRLLALIILLPAYLFLRKQAHAAPFGSTLPDKLIAGFLILQVLLMLSISSFTNTLRIGVFYAFIDAFLPYYVASRAPISIRNFREAITGFVLAALLLSSIGAFEFTRHWLLYASLDKVLGSPWDLGDYLARGGEGTDLRAQGTTGQPIPFGYVMAVAIGFLLYLKRHAVRPVAWHMGLALLALGLFSSLSRGPWIGAAAMVVIFIAAGPAPLKGFARLGLLSLLLIPLVLATTSGQKIAELLPFIGSASTDNVDYRQRLAEISMQVIMENPFFGAFDYFYSPAMQELRQGQGIIDIVNTYLAIGLGSGLVGLALFAGFFVTVAISIFKGMRLRADRNDESYALGQCLLATLLGIMVMIATVSSITVIPVIYWSVAGLGVAYARMLRKTAPVVAGETTSSTGAPQADNRFPAWRRPAGHQP